MTDEELALEQQDVEPPAEEEDEASREATAKEKLKAALLIDKQEIGPLRLKMTITVPKELVHERLDEQFKELRREAMVPGFRKGHAPLKLVEKRFGTEVGDQLVTQLVSNAYLAAVEREELDPLGDPLVWTKVKEERSDVQGGTKTVEEERLLGVEQAVEHIKLPKDDALTFVCELELRPKFELPELKGIPVTRPQKAVTDEDVERDLEYVRNIHANYKPVEGGSVQENDLLYGSVRLTVEDQVLLEEAQFDLAARDVRIAGVRFVGLGQALTGKKVGDDVRVEAPVPDDHENITLRGKQAVLEYKIQEIKRQDVPPLDDALAQSLGYDSVEELRSDVRRRLELQKDRFVREAMFEQIGKYLLDHTTLEVPEGMSQRQADRMVARHMVDLYRQNVPEAEIYKVVDEMKVQAKAQSVRDLKLHFIVEKISEQLDVKVGEDEINSAIASIAARQNRRFDRVRDELAKNEGLFALYWRLRDEKIFERLLADANVTEATEPPPAAT